MSTSWSAPDSRRRTPIVPGFGHPYVLPAQPGPPPREDAFAGLLAAVVTVLVGAPVGLLWAALAPRVEVLVAGENVTLAEPASDAFIAADAYFLLAMGVAGVVTGLVAWRLGRAHGPGVVLGLTVGGLAAGYVAMVTGQQVGLDGVEAAVAAGHQGLLELSLRLRAPESIVAWPVAALLAYLGASLLKGR